MKAENFVLKKHNVDYDVKETRKRYLNLYTGLIYDAMESLGLSGRAMSSGIYPLSHEMKVAGPAFTCHGIRTPSRNQQTHDIRLGMLKSMTDGCIQIRDTQGDRSCGHFGEISATAARAEGCMGAVIDGSTRDSNYLINMKFPTFCRFRNPVEAFGRFMIIDYQVPIWINGIDGLLIVNPGDYIFGDNDGVVIVPEEKTIEILEIAENWFSAEAKSRNAMEKGDDPFEVYKRFGRF